jgi:hypothetical protein
MLNVGIGLAYGSPIYRFCTEPAAALDQFGLKGLNSVQDTDDCWQTLIFYYEDHKSKLITVQGTNSLVSLG